MLPVPSLPRRGALALVVLISLLGPTAGASAATNNIFTVAGTTLGFSGDGGPATLAQLRSPTGIAATADGGYLIADFSNDRVRRVSPSGTITTVAGDGTHSFGGDNGPAIAAHLSSPIDVATTADGGFLIADQGNNRIRRVSPGGTITTVAGTSTSGSGGDGGAATAAQLSNPSGVAATSDGGFLIADLGNARVRRVSPDGTIATAAGNGAPGFAGDGGPATAAQLHDPDGVAATPDGGFLIADELNQRVRRVSPAGTITTVAGTGATGFTGDGGPATAAQLDDPAGLAATADGGFLIADQLNHRVRRVSPGGTITTVAGNGTAGATGDGALATSAELSRPAGVAATAEGGFLIADETSNNVRFVDADLRPGPSGPAGQQGPAGTQGPQGPQGAQGPRGNPGATFERLLVALAEDKLRARRGTRLRLRYVVTIGAAVTVELRKGTKRLTRLARTVRAGRNTLSFKLPKTTGRLNLKLTAQGNGQKATDQAELTLTR